VRRCREVRAPTSIPSRPGDRGWRSRAKSGEGAKAEANADRNSAASMFVVRRPEGQARCTSRRHALWLEASCDRRRIGIPPAFRSIGGRNGIAVLISAYFDESAEGDSQNGLLSVSGYALDMVGVDRLIPEWKQMLDKYRLPYFHMSECNACSGIYDHLDDDECDECARAAIQIARSHPLHGHAFAVDQSEYREIMQNHGFDCDPYTFMVWGIFIHVNRWVHENRSNQGISLYFESGYQTQRRANELLQALSQDQWGGKNHVVRYEFVRKETSEPTQAADLVAWHVRKLYENIRNGKPARRDTQALIKDRRVLTIAWTAERLKKLRDDFCRKSGSLENAAKNIFSQIDRSADEGAL
jgi:hypothetical protein